MWWIFALLSAVFAALTSILAKVRIEDVDSTLATAIRTVAECLGLWCLLQILNRVFQVSVKKAGYF